MDPSARRIRSVWPKNHRRNGTRDEHKHLDKIHEQQICPLFLMEHLISLQFKKKKIHFSVRTVFQSECVLNTFNMVISGMKTQFYN